MTNLNLIPADNQQIGLESQKDNNGFTLKIMFSRSRYFNHRLECGAEIIAEGDTEYLKKVAREHLNVKRLKWTPIYK